MSNVSFDSIKSLFPAVKYDPSLMGKPGILPDHEILRLCQEEDFIAPFVISSIKVDEDGKRIFSYGVSSYGYDVRLSTKFRIFTDATQFEKGFLDPHDLDLETNEFAPWVDYEGDFVTIPPNGFVLGYTREYIKMPRDVTGIISNKSSYARAGISVTTSIIEPGWEGTVVLEIANLTPRPVRVYAHEGVAQFIFFRGERCTVSYADRDGKYSRQYGLVMPRI